MKRNILVMHYLEVQVASSVLAFEGWVVALVVGQGVDPGVVLEGDQGVTFWEGLLEGHFSVGVA